MRSSRPCRLAGLAAAALLAAMPAQAQENQSQQPLARAQGLLRQLAAQKQELETANARLSAEVAALEQKLARAESGLKQASASLASEQRKAERTGGALQGAQDRLGRTEEQLRETVAKLRATTASLQDSQRQVAALEGQLAETRSQLADSERKNLQLYQANLELLDLYRDKGAWAALLQREPTGLKNVEIENVIQEYQLKLEDSLAEANRRPDGAPQSASTP